MASVSTSTRGCIPSQLAFLKCYHRWGSAVTITAVAAVATAVAAVVIGVPEMVRTRKVELPPKLAGVFEEQRVWSAIHICEENIAAV
jgi:hypothetical protein